MGDVVLFMDDCHSGGGTRGDMKVRGGVPSFSSKKRNAINHFKSDSSLLYKQVSLLLADASKLSTYEVFSATGPEDLIKITGSEAIKEIKPCGKFSFDIIGLKNKNFELGKKYKIIEKIIGIDTSAEYKGFTLFYVTS